MPAATFTDPERVPQGMTLRLWPIALLVGVVGVVAVGGALLYLRSKTHAKPAQQMTDMGIWPASIQQPPVYAPPQAQAATLAPPVRPERPLPAAPQPPAIPPVPAAEPERPLPAGPTPAPVVQVARPSQQTTPSQAQQPETPVVRAWLFAEMHRKEKPFATPRGRVTPVATDGPPRPAAPRQDEEPAGHQPGTLITPASWEVPADRTRTLYPSMAIYAALEHDVNSDIPGQMRLVVVQDVQDKFFQGQILLPQYTHLFAEQDGVPRYGQAGLNLRLRLAETPQGTMLDFTKAVAQDGTGQAGLRGTVDYHWVQVGAAALLTALMSTATQSLVQHRGTFYPSFEEQAAANAARSLDQSGQAIVRRELERPPTIRLKRGTPVMIQLKEAISLQTPPLVVER